MRNKDFFKGDIIKCCAVCKRGRISASKKEVFCEKHGVMLTGDCCKKFVYEPLKRIPKQPDIGTFTAEDFSL